MVEDFILIFCFVKQLSTGLTIVAASTQCNSGLDLRYSLRKLNARICLGRNIHKRQKDTLQSLPYYSLTRKLPSSFSTGWVLTHSQGHDAKLVPDQPDHLALLQRSGPAADDCLASTAQLKKVILQLLLQGPVQRATIYNQNEASHTAWGGFSMIPCCSQFSQTVFTTVYFQFELLK